jgi:hypothetical protein
MESLDLLLCRSRGHHALEIARTTRRLEKVKHQ